jgi:hypothetical protein
MRPTKLLVLLSWQERSEVVGEQHLFTSSSLFSLPLFPSYCIYNKEDGLEDRCEIHTSWVALFFVLIA